MNQLDMDHFIKMLHLSFKGSVIVRKNIKEFIIFEPIGLLSPYNLQGNGIDGVVVELGWDNINKQGFIIISPKELV